MSKWTLFSNHGHVLLFLSQDPEARLRDVADSVGITERAVQKIVRDLQDGGMLSVTKHGRRNRYRIHTRKSLRHPLETHCTVGQLVELIDQAGRLPADRIQTPAKAVEAEPEPAPPPQPPSSPKFPAPDPVAEPRESTPEEPAKDAGEQGSLF